VASCAPPAPLVEVTGGGATLETVKLAEDGSGDVVVRLYEAAGARAAARVSLGFVAATVTVTDLLERPIDPGGDLPVPAVVEHPEGGYALTLRPFQIVTLRLARS
jgi:alpha-mannosidase